MDGGDIEALEQMPVGTTIYYALYYDGWHHQLATKDVFGVWFDPNNDEIEFDFSEYVPNYIAVHDGRQMRP